jgi:hypothetical protein
VLANVFLTHKKEEKVNDKKSLSWSSEATKLRETFVALVIMVPSDQESTTRTASGTMRPKITGTIHDRLNK